MNNKILIVVAALIAIAAGAWFLTQESSQPGSTEIAQSSDASGIDTGGVKDFTLGDADAPVTVIEYLSFTCPHCKTFHENTFKQLKADYIDTGKVKFVIREVYFDRYGLWAGLVARCGGGDRYFGLVDLIFENQREWTQGEPAAIAANLKRLGKLAGLEEETLDACLQDGEKAEALNAFFQQNSERDGVRSTPSFVINGQLHSNMSYADMQLILDGELS